MQNGLRRYISHNNNKSYVFSDARFPTHDEQLRIQERECPWGESQWALVRSCLRSAHRIFARGAGGAHST